MALVTELASDSEEILMTINKRTLAVFAGLTVLAISSQAQTISNISFSTGSATSYQGTLDVTPTEGFLSYSPASTIAYGSFTLTGPASYVDVDAGSLLSAGGTVDIKLYTASTTFFDSGALSTGGNVGTFSTGSLFTGSPVTVYYSETLSGTAIIGAGQKVTFSSTPEPASYAVMGLGLVGLVIRRKKGAR